MIEINEIRESLLELIHNKGLLLVLKTKETDLLLTSC